jgi:hypothetical protein
MPAAQFSRLIHKELSGVLIDYLSHPIKPELIELIMYEDGTYTIYEIDIFHNEWFEVASYTGGIISHIAVWESLDMVYVTWKSKDAGSKFEFYSFRFGDSVDFDNDDPEAIESIGDKVYSIKTEGTDAIVIFEDYDHLKVGIYINDDFRIVEDKFHMLDETEDYAIMGNGQVICLKEIIGDSFEYFVINEKIKTLESSIYKVKEFSEYKYWYPYLLMIKGGNEVFRYNFTRNKFIYLKLNSSFVGLENQSYEHLSYTGLLDLGDYYAKAVIDWANGESSDFILEVNKRYIVKKHLPKSKLLGCFPNDLAKFGGNIEEEAFFIHMSDYIVAYSMHNNRRLSFLKIKYDQREIIYHKGLLLAKRDSKKIYYVKAPCNFNDSADYFAVYESSNLIKDFVLSRNEDEFYLVDKTGGVKIVRLERVSELYTRETLKVSKDYFVEKNFIGGAPFNLSDSMMYYGFKGYLLQDMKFKNEELTTEYDLNLDEYLTPLDIPFISKNSIVFIGQVLGDK